MDALNDVLEMEGIAAVDPPLLVLLACPLPAGGMTPVVAPALAAVPPGKPVLADALPLAGAGTG